MSDKDEGELKDDLTNYNPEKYKRPSVTCDIAICTIKDGILKVLLIKRKYPPFKNCWALPGGFVDIDAKETLDETAYRELKEETHLDNLYIEQLKTYGDPDRDPRMRVITVAYYALVPSTSLIIKAGDDAKEADWFPLSFPWKGPKLGFDHEIIIKEALMRLRGKILYSPIAFSLLPEKFTWSQLQIIYETILGKKLIPTNFRRKLNSIYHISVTEKIKPKIGRPFYLLQYDGTKSI